MDARRIIEVGGDLYDDDLFLNPASFTEYVIYFPIQNWKLKLNFLGVQRKSSCLEGVLWNALLIFQANLFTLGILFISPVCVYFIWALKLIYCLVVQVSNNSNKTVKCIQIRLVRINLSKEAIIRGYRDGISMAYCEDDFVVDPNTTRRHRIFQVIILL